MPPRVTLQELARHLGLHHTSVSRALAGNPKISAATRERVRRAAAALGYRPDPVARALAVHRHALRPVEEYGTLAWMTQGRHRVADRPGCVESFHLAGAVKRAGELGFRIEEFPCHAPDLSDERLSTILESRGIRGVVVGPWFHGPREERRLHLNWSAFSAVCIGHGLYDPLINRVCSNHYRAMREVVRRLVARGYRRIAAVIPSDAAEENWRAGFQVETLTGVEAAFFWETGFRGARENRRKIRETGVEALIVMNDECAAPWLENFRVPGELAVVSCTISTPGGPITGIHQNYPYIGERAVDLLVHYLYTHQRGIPPHPERVLIEGVWNEGATIRPGGVGG